MVKRAIWWRCHSLIALFYMLAAFSAEAEGELPASVTEKVTEKKSAFDKEGRSSAGLVSVIGKDQGKRSGILSVAEKLRTELFEIGNKGYEKQKLPIVIQLIGKKGDEPQALSMVSKLERVEGAFRIKLYIHLANTIDHELLQYHLMEVLLYERGLSDNQIIVEGERVLVKPWLITGLLEAIKIKRGMDDREIYQADVDYFEVLDIEKVFLSNEPDFRKMMGMQPMAFRAISGAMVNSLLRQKNGAANMESYIADFATFKGESGSLMRKHFPGMNKSKNSLQKWVELEMLELGTANTSQVLSILETDSRLESYLKFSYKEDDVKHTLGIDGYRELLDLKDVDRVNIVNRPKSELQRLSYRCFPEYRPIIFEYLAILNDVSRGKGEDLDIRLVTLGDTRERMRAVSKRTTDYLNWHYITQSNQVGGDFKQYREISDALEKEAKKVQPDDRMGDYLDSVQRMFTER